MGSNLPRDCQQCLERTVKHLVSNNKGILILDTLISNVETSLRKTCTEMNAENLRMYRQIFLTANSIYLKGISGVLFDDEASTQQTDDGRKFTDIIKAQNLLMGISSNIGYNIIDKKIQETVPLLDMQNLQKRCAKYLLENYSFTTLKICIIIDDNLPTEGGLRRNAYVLGLFAAVCQKNFLVPILVITIANEGAHSMEYCSVVLKRFFGELSYAFCNHDVLREGLLIAMNFIAGGKQNEKVYTPKEIAAATMEFLLQTVVPAIPGIFIIFEGGRVDESMDIFNELKLFNTIPWDITFFYGPVLQKTSVFTWYGESENIKLAQAKFLDNLRACKTAVRGEYNKEHDSINDTRHYKI